MRIMVFDVPAENGGALTVLNQYHKKAIEDKGNEWFFLISTPKLSETQHIKVLNFPWIKKSWFHRLYFDIFVAYKVVEKYQPDKILSLQNVIIQNTNVKQILYLHQSLPFVEKRYRITEDLKIWVYQNIIGKMIFRSIEKADKIIVQTRWIKEACLKKVKVDRNKIEIQQPEMDIVIKKHYKEEYSKNKIFFYPANDLPYKNHRIIIEAAKELKKRNLKNYKIIFTLTGNENKNIKRLYKRVKELSLPISFIGQINLDEVYEYYSKSILIFPSYIESYGLPMLEAKMHGTPILASNCAFSHEILDGYDDVKFFDAFDNKMLTNLMEEIIITRRCFMGYNV